MICSLCPELTNNMENWCEDCIATKELTDTAKRFERNRMILKPLMKETHVYDVAEHHDMC